VTLPASLLPAPGDPLCCAASDPRAGKGPSRDRIRQGREIAQAGIGSPRGGAALTCTRDVLALSRRFTNQPQGCCGPSFMLHSCRLPRDAFTRMDAGKNCNHNKDRGGGEGKG